MPLSLRQATVLRYLGDRKSATARNVSRDLLTGRTAAQNALRDLAGKGLVSKDPATFPASWSVTDIGAALLAAAANEREPQ
jgi:DNA-binding MarR family transcriptional regulator